jgi:hypothetical protein
MAFQVSPGVNVQEIDLTLIVPSVATTVGAYSGDFSWGPAYDIQLIENEGQLVSQFGKPNARNYVSFFTAANFLAYGNKLRVVRSVDTSSTATAFTGVSSTGTAVTGTGFLTGLNPVRIGDTIVFGLQTRTVVAVTSNTTLTVDSAFTPDLVADNVVINIYTGALNATSEATTGSNTPGLGLLVTNEDDYLTNHADGLANVGAFVAKYPGNLGNSLRVSICPSALAHDGILAGVTSTGTALTIASGFNARLEPGSIIRNSSGIERTVVTVISDTSATLNAAFPTNLVAETVTVRWQYYGAIRFTPGTSAYVAQRSGVGDEMNIVVIDEDGAISGQAGTVLERFILVSKASDAKKEDGSSNYYVDRINRDSKYIWWTDHLASGVNWGSTAQGTTFTNVTKPESYSLSGGSEGAVPSNAEVIQGYDLFGDPENVDISLILAGSGDATVCTYLINNLAETRKDCIVCLSPQFSDVVGNAGQEAEDIISFRNNLPSSSYAVMDSGWKYQYDKYNDQYRWVPLNADVAGCMVRTDTERDPWYSPAGLNRGQIKNVTKLAYNPNRADRDDLYLSGVNSVVQFPGQGTVLWGDKTLLSTPSAFDRINVRRLFIVLEKSISLSAKYMLFELNNEATRSRFVALIEPYLKYVKSREGVQDFYIQCNSLNNTPEVIDRNEFRGSIFIKPSRSINFIELQFVAVRTETSFSTLLS